LRGRSRTPLRHLPKRTQEHSLYNYPSHFSNDQPTDGRRATASSRDATVANRRVPVRINIRSNLATLVAAT
jgi:hypothetical protein